MGAITEVTPDTGIPKPDGIINNSYVVTEAEETESGGTADSNPYSGTRRQSDTGRRQGFYHKTHPKELAKLQEAVVVKNSLQLPNDEGNDKFEEIELGNTRLRKISSKKTSSDNSWLHVPPGAEDDRKISRISSDRLESERKISQKDRKISAMSKISFDETVEGATELRRNESIRTSTRPQRKISAFQKAIETIAHVHVDIISLKDGSVFEMFVPKKSPQILAAMAATIGAFGMGTVMAWSSPALPQLENNTKLGNPSSQQLSWIASLVPLAGAFAGPLTGKCIQWIGRKPTMIAISIPFVIGWLLIAYAINIYMILAGRFLTGYCAGAISLTAPVFISETAEDSIRGMLGSGFHLMITLGILFSYIIGAFVDWQWLAMISGCVPVLMCLIMLYVPASPRYLIQRDRIEDATKALMWFRGATTADQVQEELNIIMKAIQDTKEVKINFREFLTPGVMKPLCVSIGLMILQSFSGSDAITFYTVNIFREAGSTLDGSYATIIVGIVQVLATMLSLVLVEKAGRRALLLLSDLFMCISHLALGSFFLLQGDLKATFALLPLVSLVVFVSAYSVGFGPVPWMMMGEVLPHHVIGPASAIATSFNWFCAFLVIRFFEDIKDEIGPSWCYIGFAISCGLGIIFVFFVVPETKGKSLDEIQQIFVESKGPITKKSKERTRKISKTTVDSLFFA